MLYLLFHPRSQWLVPNRSRVTDNNCVALTFDDGPDPLYTPKLLDLLRDKDVKATFFVIGEQAQQHPEIVRRAWEEGHLIATHTWSHPLLFCFLTPRRLRQEVENGVQGIRDICGVSPRHFRSPVGLRHPMLNIVLKNAGLEYVSWRVKSCDTLIRNPQTLASRIMDKTTGGDIILLHDRLPQGTGAMLQVLPGIIDDLREKGLEFVLAGPRGDSENHLCESAR